MKNIYSFFLFLLSFSFLHSQTYYPLLDSANEWRYCADMVGVRVSDPNQTATTPCMGYPYFYYENAVQYTSTDTLINSYTYKRLIMGEPNWASYCLFGFIREDTASKKVFFQDIQNNPEVLLYDFSMAIGDTINVNFISSAGYYMNGNYILDSIHYFTIDAGVRRLFYLNNPSGGHTLTWIESVGNPGNLVYPYSQNSFAAFHFYNCQNYFQHDYYELMTCFHHNNTRVYYDSCSYHTALNDGCIFTQDTCNYWNICGAIHENSSLGDVEIFPNPSNGVFTMKVEMNKRDQLEISVHDVAGRNVMNTINTGILFSGITQLQLDLSQLPTGAYFIEIHSENGTLYEQIGISK